MPVTYPAPPPTISGDFETISRFLNTPTLIQRELRTIGQNRFIGDVVLSGRAPASGGAVLYEQNESIFTDRDPESIEPSGDFPKSPVGTGPALISSVKKWGLDVPVSDEAIKRFLRNPVDRALQKIINTVVRKVDSVALTEINNRCTQTQGVTTAWATSTHILRDVLTGKATVAALNQGYDLDTVVLDDLTWAILMSDPTIQTGLRREDPQNPIYTGQFPVIAGMRFLPTSNLPTAGRAYALDSKVLGSMVDELPLTGGSRRNEDNEEFILRGKRVVVPIVQEPNACIVFTGI